VAAVARERRASRVVCASAGNLGQTLAYSGRRRGLKVTVVAARTANPLKLRQIAGFGADVRLEGEDIEDARLLARELAEAGGAYLVEDSLDLATCEGAATIGLELARDDPGLDVVLVALGGGAMASGVGYAVRSLAEHVEVIGIQPVGPELLNVSPAANWDDLTGPVLATKPFHGAWVLSTSYTDHADQPVGYGTLLTTCPNTQGNGLDASCLAAKGFHAIEIYHPDSHFWALQGIETGIYLAAAIALLGAATWWATRRIS